MIYYHLVIGELQKRCDNTLPRLAEYDLSTMDLPKHTWLDRLLEQGNPVGSRTLNSLR